MNFNTSVAPETINWNEYFNELELADAGTILDNLARTKMQAYLSKCLSEADFTYCELSRIAIEYHRGFVDGLGCCQELRKLLNCKCPNTLTNTT